MNAHMFQSWVLMSARALLLLCHWQEVLLLLEDYWSRHPQLQGIPIYQASGVARRALNVFQTYVGMMNEDIQAAFQVCDLCGWCACIQGRLNLLSALGQVLAFMPGGMNTSTHLHALAKSACLPAFRLHSACRLQFRNPFSFKHVKVLKAGTVIDESGPCVVMATPSMMQSGLSRELFEAWCESPANTVIIADFAVQGTLAREILSSPTHITTRTGVKVCSLPLTNSLSLSLAFTQSLTHSLPTRLSCTAAFT